MIQGWDVAMNKIAYQGNSHAADIDSESRRSQAAALHRIWPVAVICLGLGLTVIWTCFLVYALARIIEMAF
jgi:hypothetical protein